jgi:hypothetical protein
VLGDAFQGRMELYLLTVNRGRRYTAPAAAPSSSAAEAAGGNSSSSSSISSSGAGAADTGASPLVKIFYAGPALAPRSVRATALSCTTARVRWRKPADCHSPVAEYRLQSSGEAPHKLTVSAAAASSSSSSSSVASSSDDEAAMELSAVVGGLYPGTTYTFTAVAVNAFGAGARSSTSAAFTVTDPANDCQVSLGAATTVMYGCVGAVLALPVLCALLSWLARVCGCSSTDSGADSGGGGGGKGGYQGIGGGGSGSRANGERELAGMAMVELPTRAPGARTNATRGVAVAGQHQGLGGRSYQRAPGGAAAKAAPAAAPAAPPGYQQQHQQHMYQDIDDDDPDLLEL